MEPEVPKTLENTNFHLYSYFRSSCSGRLRIALALKGIPVQTTTINLLTNEHRQAPYTEVNPSLSVPTLIITTKNANNTTKTIQITQSLAALEYLDEAFPHTTPLLLPPLSSPDLRATVRTLVSILACDLQPPSNMRILNRARALASASGADPAAVAQQWAKEVMTEGLVAYEAVCKETAGRYSVGDEVTMADVCLVPAIWGAERWGVEMAALPTVQRVYEELSKLDAVVTSHWKRQGDTPEALRG